MKQIVKLTACILLIAIIPFISCKKELDCSGCKENKPPVAYAGSDRLINLPMDSVLLDGTASSDPDGTITSYKWAKIAGPVPANIIKADSSKTSVRTLVAGVYRFELTVTDNGGLSAKDTVHVFVDNPVINQPPVACAGANHTITLPVNSVYLDARCSADPENNITTYEWAKILGPAATIATPNTSQTQVTVLLQGVYQFELKVTDSGGLISKDTAQVTVNAAACDVNSRPTLNATFLEIGTLSEARTPQVGAAGSKIVFAGGNRTLGSTEVPYMSSSSSAAVDIYDINTHVWTIAKLSMARSNMAVVTAGNKIFFAGGNRHQQADEGPPHYPATVDNVDIYDASTNTWSFAYLSKRREFISAAAIGNKVIFAGGGESDAVDMYDISTGKWSTAKLSVGRNSPTPVVIGNKVYFAGGFPHENAVDVYNSSTDTWSTSTLPDDIALAGTYQLANYLVWGHQKPVKIKNTTSGAVITNCISGGVFNITGLKNDGIVFFTGSNLYNALKSFDFYNPVTGTWYVGKVDQNFPGKASAGVITVNNTIYVAGGVNPTVNSYSAVYSNKVYTLNW